jgi:type II secretory pathway pseudopilin PulG
MRFKARRGAVVVMLGIMIAALVSISAISIDFSRLWALRNELQTSADAAALAGAIQLLPPNNAGNTITVATSYANVNLAMSGPVTVDSVTPGDWDDALRTFTPNAPFTDAVSVTVSRQSGGLIMSLLGVASPRVKARAIGWSGAPVNSNAGCLRPIAVPFTQLMYKINVNRGIANTPDTNGLYRPFDQVQDMAALSNMTAAERTFSLKIGSGQIADTLGAISGEYQAVQLPELWDVTTQNYTNPGPVAGASAFRDAMAGVTCDSLTVGDSLVTQTGVMAGPTICGAFPGAQGCGAVTGPGICSMVRGDQADPLGTLQSSTNYGNCEDASGNVGQDIVAAFYRCMTGCSGNSHLEVSLLGNFTLMKVFPDNSRGGAYTQFDKAQIVGIFKPTSNPGTVGPGATLLQRPILVK